MFSRKIFAVFAAFAFLLVTGCTDAQTTLESLSLKYAELPIRQGGVKTSLLVVNKSTNNLTFEFDCSHEHDRLQISFDEGTTWNTLLVLDPTKKVCQVNQTLSIPDTAAWPIVKALLKTKGEDSTETRATSVSFLKPDFKTPSVVINNGDSVTNIEAYTVQVDADLEAGSLGGIKPTEVYLTNAPGCASGGEWKEFKTTGYGRTIAAKNIINYTYAKFRDAGGNESSCVNDGILHDDVAPVAVSLVINGGAAKATNVSASLSTLAAGDAKEMQLNNTADCTGTNDWEPYSPTKTWTLPGPGVNTISVRFRDEAGNLSACVKDDINFDTNPPATPATVTLALGVNALDNDNPVSIEVNPVAAGDIAKIYADSACSTMSLGEAAGTNGANAIVPVALPANSDGKTITLWAKVFSAEGLGSGCSATSASYTLDSTAPTVTDVTTSTANGNYTTGSPIDVALTFSENVVTSGPGLGIYLNINGVSVFAPYASGSGSKTLHFTYTVLATHLSARLDYAGTSAVEFGGATLTDMAGNKVNAALPVTNSYGLLWSKYNISVNYTLSIARAPGINAIDSKNPVDIVVYGLLNGYTAKLYTDSTCTTFAAQATATGGGSVTVPVSLTGDGTRNFYVKVFDPVGNPGNCSTFFATYTLDGAVPSILNVTSSTANGNYTTGSSIVVSLIFSKAVAVSGAGMYLNMNLNGTAVQAPYTSGSGTNTLYFNYNIGADHFSAGLEYDGVNALKLGTASIVDGNNNPASITLPAAGGTGSLSANKKISINYDVNLSLAAGTNPIDSKNPVSVVVGGVTTGYTAKVYTDATCTTQVGQADSTGGTIATVPVNLAQDGIRTFYARIFDLKNTGTACSTSSVTYRLDTTGPMVTQVTSSNTNGNYTTGSTIDVSVVFSENVVVTGTGITLNLNLNGTSVAAPYSSGNGTSTLHFNYSPQSGHLSNDLDAHGTTALQIATATIKDAVGNTANIKLPAPGTTNSLSANKDISINYDPTLTLGPGQLTIDNKNPVTIEVSSVMNGFTAKLYTDATCMNMVGQGTSTSNSATVNAMLGADGLYSFYYRIFDTAGMGTTCQASALTYTLDSTGPVVTSVSSTTANGSYVTGNTIDVSVNFNEPVKVTGSSATLGLDLNGQVVNATYTSGSDSTTLHFTYTVLSNNLSNDLDFASTTALQKGTATLTDSLGNAANLNLPTKGGANSLAGNKDLKVNYSVALALEAGTGTTDSKDPVNVVVSGIMRGFSAKVYSDSGCNNLMSQATSQGGGTATVSAKLSGDATYTFYAKSVDTSGTESTCSTASVSYTLDTSGPTVMSVTSNNASQNYTTGAILYIVVNWSKPVTVTGTGATLALNLNGTTVYAPYDSGSGTSALIFKYTVASSHLTDSLEYSSTTALQLGSATIKDGSGKDSIRTLPPPGAANSLSANTDISINNTVSLSLAAGILSTDNHNPVTIVVSGVQNGYAANLYTDASCSNLVASAVATSGGKVSIDVTLPSDGTHTYYARLLDMSSNPGSCSSESVTYTLDTVGPGITSVTSTNTNGEYATGSIIDISVVFQEPVIVSGSGLSVTLGFLGNISSDAPYSYGSGTNTLHFSYVVQRTHATIDLDLLSASALNLGTGTIRDSLGNDALITLPSPGSTVSLGGNKNISINTNITISQIIPPPSRTYFVNEYVEFIVVWSGPVAIVGSPVLNLKSGTKVPSLTYQSTMSTATESRFTGYVSNSQWADSSLEVTSLTVGSGSSIKNIVTTPTSAILSANLTIPNAYKVFGDVWSRTTSNFTLSLDGTRSYLLENSGSTSFSVFTNMAPPQDTEVEYKVIGVGGGIADSDYSLSSPTTKILSTGTAASGIATITDNAVASGTKTFALQAISSSLGAFNGLAASKLISIRDNESTDTVSMIASGSAHACVLYSSGRLQCFGSNIKGQLGNGLTTPVSTPTTPYASGVLRVYAAGNSTCVILTDASLWCWGENTNGVLGTGNTTDSASPVKFTFMKNGDLAIDLAMTQHTSCLTYGYWNGGVTYGIRCWGQNTKGQVGNGNTTSPILTPVDVKSNYGQQPVVSTSGTHTCAYAPYSGTMACWGENTSGAFGNGNTTNSLSPSSSFSTGKAFTQLVAHNGATCGLVPAVLSNPTSIYCWGSDANGQLGDGGTSSSNTSSIPSTAVAVGGTPVSILGSKVPGSGPFCALRSDGMTVCWGNGGAGEMFNGTSTTNNYQPVTTYLTGLAKLSIGQYIACGVDNTTLANVVCATLESTLTNSGSLPMRRYLNPDDGSPLPRVLNNQSAPSSMFAVNGGTSCYTNADGTLYCNSSGYSTWMGFAGDGYTYRRNAPVRLNLANQNSVTTSASNACALGQNKILRCWGTGTNGQVGDGATSYRAIPTFVMSDILKVKTSGDAGTYGGTNTTTCALKSNGSLSCWGYNNYGQVGSGSNAVTYIAKPTEVISSGVTDFALSNNFTCAIVNGIIKCVGANTNGGLGDASATDSLTFVETLDGYGGIALQIEGGDNFMCARFDDNSLRCWGVGTSGQIGRGNTASPMIFPYRIQSLAVKDFSLGAAHVCAITTTNDLKCWGNNALGQVGNSTFTNVLSPTTVMNNVTKVWANRDSSTCAVSSGRFYCWGLGSGLFNFRIQQGYLMPVPGLQY